MKRDEPLSYLYEGRELGTGGKLKKMPSRKPPTTPYARPFAAKQTTHRQEGGGGWLSKIVDPAYRLISSGSTRILPSFFSRSPSANATPFDHVSDESDEDVRDDDEDVRDDDEEKGNLNLVVGSTGDRQRCEVNFDEKIRNEEGTNFDGSQVSEIEQLLKGKSLSRDEITRLTEILHLKATGMCDVEQAKKPYPMTHQLTAVGTPAALETPIKSTQEKVKGSNKATWAASTPYTMPTHARDVAVASPVDLARAYMGSRTSEIGTSSRSLITKDERDRGDEFVTKPVLPLHSPKPICWPGAIVQDPRGYMTPQHERGKVGLHRFPRTPYSRTIFSKSKSKVTQLQGDGTKGPDTSSTPFLQFRTPLSVKVTSETYGSVGPMRRIRNKFDEIPSGSAGSHPGLYNPSNVEKSSVYAGFSPASKNFESWVTGSTAKFDSVEIKARRHEVGQASVPSQSSQIARKILDHIDRKMPTLAEKSAEVKLAIEPKRPSTYEGTNSVLNGKDTLPTVETVDSPNKMNVASQTSFSAQGNHYATNSLLKPQHEEMSGHEANNNVNQNAPSSNLMFRSFEGSAGLSFDFSKNRKSQIKNAREVFMGSDNSLRKEKTELQSHSYLNEEHHSKKVPNSSASDVLSLQKLHPRALSNKPLLPFISTNKPSLGTTQNFGFTFPVSSTSGVFSEPPTPSVMPTSFSASGGQNKTKESASIPVYTFGSKRSATPIVFSFPSTSSACANTDGSSIKFTFGSDKSSRVSFSCC